MGHGHVILDHSHMSSSNSGSHAVLSSSVVVFSRIPLAHVLVPVDSLVLRFLFLPVRCSGLIDVIVSIYITFTSM